jgi:hypothetical protein
MAYRVINWATGHIGKMVVRATAERADYEIVAAFTYSADKAGRDLGAVAGITPIGGAPTDDACMATAMHAVYAVPYMIATKPGILLLTDAPPVAGQDAFRQRAPS